MIRDFNLEAFVERVREFCFSQDKAYPEYKDMTVKENRWTLIAAEFHVLCLYACMLHVYALRQANVTTILMNISVEDNNNK